MLHCGLQQQNCFDNNSDSSVVSGVNVPLTKLMVQLMWCWLEYFVQENLPPCGLVKPVQCMFHPPFLSSGVAAWPAVRSWGWRWSMTKGLNMSDRWGGREKRKSRRDAQQLSCTALLYSSFVALSLSLGPCSNIIKLKALGKQAFNNIVRMRYPKNIHNTKQEVLVELGHLCFPLHLQSFNLWLLRHYLSL